MKRQSLHVKDNAIYDHFTKQQVIWTHGYGVTDRYVTRNEWGALLLQWPVPTYYDSWGMKCNGCVCEYQNILNMIKQMQLVYSWNLFAIASRALLKISKTDLFVAWGQNYIVFVL